MMQKVFKSGNSLTVVVPADFARNIGVEAGDEVIVNTDTERARLTIKFPAPRQLQLKEEK